MKLTKVVMMLSLSLVMVSNAFSGSYEGNIREICLEQFGDVYCANILLTDYPTPSGINYRVLKSDHPFFSEILSTLQLAVSKGFPVRLTTSGTHNGRSNVIKAKIMTNF